jgi:hypothetical protein
MWRYEAPYLVNEKGKVLDVQGQIDTEGRHIAVSPKDGKMSQQWDIVYLDDWKGEPKKGEMNTDTGFFVQRPFYLVSELKANRYLDLINNRNAVIKTRNGRNTQVWYFDQTTLTVKTKLNNQSWDIPSSGKAKTFQIWSTNSNWW